MKVIKFTCKALLPIILVMACTGVLSSDKAMAAALPDGDTTIITVEQYVNPSDPTGSYVKVTKVGYTDEPIELLFEDYREDIPGQLDYYQQIIHPFNPETIINIGNTEGNLNVYLNTKDFISPTIKGDEEWTFLTNVNIVKPSVPPTQGIPEFPTIALPVLAVLGLAFIFGRRK